MIIVVIVLAALFGTYVVLSNTDVFEIQSIEVEGSTRLSDEYLTTQVAVQSGTNLLNVDTSSVVSRLSANPWVNSVDVHRSFPHTLVLNINENYPCAVVQIDPSTANGTVHYWLIDDDCMWMSEVSADGVARAKEIVKNSTGDSGAASGTDASAASTDGSADAAASTDGSTSSDGTQAADGSDASAQTQVEQSVCTDAYLTAEELSKIPIISGVSTSISPSSGTVESDSGIANAMSILKGASEDFRNTIRQINSPTGNTTNLTLANGIEVSFGDASDIQSKIDIIEQLETQYPDQISYINVRSVDNPSWRGLK